MALENIPVWPFPADWSSPVTETLEWLTDVSQSPSGAEQRRCLRYFPRKTLDWSVVAWDDERALLDNLLSAYGAGNWYVPLWHDVRISSDVAASNFIPCTPWSFNMRSGTAIFIAGSSLFDYQIAEVSSLSQSGITLTEPLNRLVPGGSMIYPMTIGRLVEQPAQSALSDACTTAEPQFLVVEPPIDTGAAQPNEAAGLSDIYRGFYVLTLQPNWSDRTERGQQRLLSEFDNRINAPARVDTALRPFPTQKMQWIVDGAADHNKFYTLLQYLRGRTNAVWLPTWMDDMRLSGPIQPNASNMSVMRTGYTLAGGPRPEREHFMLELIDGRRFYRRITSATSTSTNERLLFDDPFGELIEPSSVLRICFITLMRLDQDSVQIEHLTDMQGVAEAEVTFRSAPDIRTATPAFVRA